MSNERLNKSIIDRAQIRDKEYALWCGRLTGFGCRIWPSGKKTFIAQYRVGDGSRKLRKKTLGTFGVLTVEQARKQAEKYLALATTGYDLAGEERLKRAEMTVSDLCSEYLQYGLGLKKSSTIATDIGRINGHILPLLGVKKIGNVTSADIDRFMHDVANGKTANDIKTKKGRSIVKGGKGTASRTVRLLGGIFSYAVKQGYLQSNPRLGVKLFKDGVNERYLSQAEIERLGDVLIEAETIGLPYFSNNKINNEENAQKTEIRKIISPHVTAAIRLLLLTGCRLREILSLKWTEVDLERKSLNLPDSKTGQKTIYLSDSCVDILNELPRIGTYVVLGADLDKQRSDLKRPWKKISEYAGLKNVRLHDLRHTFASVSVSNGMSLPMIGTLLGHKSTSTTARYAHLSDDPLRKALNETSKPLSKALKSKR